ncbi:LysR family transcriptional regulator [Vibrio sp. ZSDE26]|uniref:LysR family transcriptional regulator n=1 Tax=Vibrio amylolyticus TaxID=2847292 RepID=A0A9X1XKR0_9VIBR|nr:LysR family transcriptional regulator [Vibrio amylolyticus]MCK6263503.1 LysR family transcriptional regulator [Vibrio amylolyticus]
MGHFVNRSAFTLSLNSLRLIQVLGHEKSTARAAEKLYVTQSAISKSLKKLREQLQDELFIRHPHGLAPTPYCERILLRIPDLQLRFEEALEIEHSFNAHNYNGLIRIAISPVLYQPIVTTLFDALHQQAPNAQLHFENWSWDTDSKIKSRQLDLGINFSPIDISKGIHRTNIGQSEFKICCKSGHPIVEQGASIATMASYPLTMMILPHQYTTKHYLEQYLEEHGYEANILTKVDQMNICFEILKKTDSIMAVSDLAKNSIPEGLTLVTPQQEVEIPLLSIATYSSSNSNNAFHRWLVDMSKQCVSELKA